MKRKKKINKGDRFTVVTLKMLSHFNSDSEMLDSILFAMKSTHIIPVDTFIKLREIKNNTALFDVYDSKTNEWYCNLELQQSHF